MGSLIFGPNNRFISNEAGVPTTKLSIPFRSLFRFGLVVERFGVLVNSGVLFQKKA